METIVSENAHLSSRCTTSPPCFTQNMRLCFSSRLWWHKREKWKQRYSIITPPFIISAPSDSELSRVTFFLLNQDSFVHCVSWFFFPESEIRVRLQSASPTACRCKTTWSICCCCASPHKATRHLILFFCFLTASIQRTICTMNDFNCGVCFFSNYVAPICSSHIHIPLLTCESMKF